MALSDNGLTGLTVVDHPVVAHRVGQLRNEDTGPDRFRQLVDELTVFLAYAAFGDLATGSEAIVTPVAPTTVRVVTETVLVVPILRAGLGMVPGIQSVIPGTEVAHLGMRRDEETFAAVTYLDGLPRDLTGRRVVVCDPMLATGGSMVQAVGLVAARGAARIVALCLVASEPGWAHFHEAFPEVPVVCAALDPMLNEQGYIVPGLGDAGDRLFGPPA